eukprot:TRINITY_DN11929_c0_g1::TRINITY_DN11929_c0_g1_i1::g.16945::m.16945 TRINITY_DN11929_c0_g1::TRINITY_DN11929_c0_g1_i1::g.16945  ORF type:complete len:332 (-),score=53.69,sp/Q2KHU3/EXOS8_BOVIN/34.04/4e-44,RNase_PH/PF01138.16/1.3e-24,RNase_PH/PF01138.16/3.6e+03,RNase_PH_C/PF03725.10/9.6e+03,RNase_PH_C/PF03725.10/2.9e-06 TRINITY_DN11929_c0_g1_i1:256-1251(-)
MGEHIEYFQRIHPSEYLARLRSVGIRTVGRVKVDSVRKCLITPGSVSGADGSALVKLGDTSVLVGIKAEVGQPNDGTPDQGRIAYSIERAPFCSASAGTRLNRPSDESVVSSENLAKTIEAARLYELTDLCIVSGESCWVLYVDAYVLEDDGSSFDACMLAVSAALHNLTLPEVEVSKSGLITLASASSEAPIRCSLKLDASPISVTFALFRSVVLIDPTGEEESAADCKITITYACPVSSMASSMTDGAKDVDMGSDGAKKGRVLAVRKDGGSSVPISLVQECIDRGMKRASLLSGILRSAAAVSVRKEGMGMGDGTSEAASKSKKPRTK